MRVVDRLGSLQFDPLEVAGRNHDLVLLAREDGFDPLAEDGFVDRFADALEAHPGFGEVKTIRLPRLGLHRAFVAAVRASRRGERPGQIVEEVRAA